MLHNSLCCFCTILKTEPTHGKMSTFSKRFNPFLLVPICRRSKVLQIQNILGFSSESAASSWLNVWLVLAPCDCSSGSMLMAGSLIQFLPCLWPIWAVEHSSYGHDVSLVTSLLHDRGDIQKHALRKRKRQLWLRL